VILAPAHVFEVGKVAERTVPANDQDVAGIAGRRVMLGVPSEFSRTDRRDTKAAGPNWISCRQQAFALGTGLLVK
jgi:hypothetical protein